MSSKQNGTPRAFLIGCICLFLLLASCEKVTEPDVVSNTTISSADTSSSDDRLSSYLYSELSDKEKEYYDIIKTAADNFEPKALFDEPVEPNELRKLFVACYYSKEDNFWLSSLFYRPDDAAYSLDLSYYFTKEQVAEMVPVLEQKTKEIFAGFPENADDYQKALHIHDYLVLNTTFTKNTDTCTTFYGAIVDGKAQCEGYAFAYDYLCRKAGIPSLCVWGTNSEKATHAWNMICLNGNYYQVDCTWDDPILNEEVPGFLRHYYFLVKDSDVLGSTHFPDSRYFNWPLCTDNLNYYVREGLYCSDPSQAKEMMTRSAEKALSAGARSFGIRCSDRAVFDGACEEILRSSVIRSVFSDAASAANLDLRADSFMKYTNEDELIIQVSVFTD